MKKLNLTTCAVVLEKPFVDDKAQVILKVRLLEGMPSKDAMYSAQKIGLNTSGLRKKQMYVIVPDYDYQHRKAKNLRPGDEIMAYRSGDSFTKVTRHSKAVRFLLNVYAHLF